MSRANYQREILAETKQSHDVEAPSRRGDAASAARQETQNIDRILRCRGTQSAQRKRKRKEGRVAGQSKMLWFSTASYSLDGSQGGRWARKEAGTERHSRHSRICAHRPAPSKLDQKWIAIGFEGRGILEN